MAQLDWARAKEIFADLLELPAPERPATLARLAGENDALQRAVNGLLQAHGRAAELLEGESGTNGEGEHDTSVGLHLRPARIGPFELVEQIGRGAFGVVYRARQVEPVEREVALKLLRRRGDPELLAAFRAEQRVLARMEHPGIARLLDVGLTPDDRPFVVMELVAGVSIVSYCESRELALPDRLRLFIEVCRAIHHAHQQAVLHRDLKPSNVLVTEVDGRATPKVIDFGIALPLKGDAPVPIRRRVAGTPRYMSPEQLRPGAHPDVRSDVFSLGVLLGELLAGTLPRTTEGTTWTGLRPSALLSAPLDRQARRRRRALRGDLDEIVAKATAADPEQRYDSAAALADDIHRHLAHLPLEGAPAGPLRRIGKFVRRHRAATLGASLAAVALLVGTVSALVAMRTALAARDQAVWRGYIANIAAAASAAQNGEFQRLRSHLAAAAPRHRDWEWRYLSNLAERALKTIPAGDWVFGFAQSPDGALLAAGGRDGAVRIFDAFSGETVRRIEGDSDQIIFDVAFRHDASHLAVGSEDGAVQVWEVAAGRLLAELPRHATRVAHLAYTADDRLLVAYADGTARLWDPAGRTPLRTLDDQPGGIHGVVSSPHSDLLLTWNNQGLVWLRDATLARLHDWRFDWQVTSGAISSDARLLAVGGGEGDIAVCETTGRLRFTRTPATTAAVFSRALAFSPDGTRLAGNQSRCISVWSTHDGNVVEALLGHEEAVSGVGFSPDGKVLRSASWDRTLRFWELGGRTGSLVATLQGHEQAVMAVAFSPDESLVASAAQDGTVRLWNPELALPIATLRGHTARIYGLAFAPDGASLATGGYDNTARIWSARTGAPLDVLPHDGPLWSVDYDPSGARLATGGDEGIVRIWDLAAGEVVHTMTGHTRRVTELTYSPDGRRLASASRDRSVRIWDSASGRLLHELTGHDSDVFAVVFSADGRLLYTGARDRSVRIWEVGSGRQEAVIAGHGQFVTSLSLHADGRRLAAGSWLGEVVFLDLDTRDVVTSFREHDLTIRDLSFSPSGRWLVTGSHDHTAHLLDDAPPPVRREQRDRARAAADAAEQFVTRWSAAHPDAPLARLLEELPGRAQDPTLHRWIELTVLARLCP